MKFFSFLSTFILLHLSTQSENILPDDNIFSQIPGQNITHYNQLYDIQNTTEVTYLLFLYKNTSVNSKIIAGYLVNIGKQLQYIAEILKIDCNDFVSFPQINICQETSSRDSFPKMKLLVPPEYKINPYTGAKLHHRDISYSDSKISETSIYNFITKNIPSFAKRISDIDFSDFITDNYLYNKIILFTDKPKAPLMFRGLTNLFYDRVEFAIVNNTQKDMLEYFQIKKFPSIIGFITNERDYPLEKPTYFPYDGGINIVDIKNFIEKFAYPIKRYELESQGKLTKNKTLNDIFTFLNRETLDRFFEKYRDKNIILFFNIEPILYQTIEKFAKETHGFIEYGFVDCNGWEDVCRENFKLTEFPSIRFFKTSSKVFEREMFDVGFNYDKILYNFYQEFKTSLKQGKVKDILNFVQASFDQNKIPLVYLYEGDLLNPAVYFILKENIAKHFEILSIKNPTKEEINQNKFPSPPTILVFIKKEGKDSAQILHYKGDITYVDLYAFFNKILKSQQLTSKDGTSSPTVTQIDNLKSFNETCYSQEKSCLIAFLDARPLYQTTNSYELKTIESLSKFPVARDFVFMWVNATCHDEIVKSFGVDTSNLPDLVAYFPQTEHFSYYHDKLNKDSISNFMEKFTKWETTLNRLKYNELKFNNVKCSEIKEIIKNTKDTENEEEIEINLEEENTTEEKKSDL